MSLIGMLESFFILSLGITFVLILFLVYHFKQRILAIESKCDTTFEIMNSIVSELEQIRTVFHTPNTSSMMASSHVNSGHAVNEDSHTKISVSISEDESDSDDDDDDYDDDADDDDDDDDADADDDDADADDDDADADDDDADDDDADDQIVDGSENVGNSILSADDNSNTIRIINMDNQPEIDIIDNIEELQDINEDNNDTQDESALLENLETTDIHVEKLQTDESNLDDLSVSSSTVDHKSNSHVYKKMNLTLLKAFVIEKGLTSDPSKMKKQELLQLIESSDI